METCNPVQDLRKRVRDTALGSWVRFQSVHADVLSLVNPIFRLHRFALVSSVYEFQQEHLLIAFLSVDLSNLGRNLVSAL